MKKYLFLFIIPVFFLILFACSPQNPLSPDTDPISNPPPAPPSTNSGTVSTNTNTGSITTNISKPTGLTATKGTLNSKVGLSWNSCQYASVYDIYRDGMYLTSTVNTSYEDASSGYTTWRYYYIVAKHASLSSSNSAQVYGYGQTTPPNPDPSIYTVTSGNVKTIFFPASSWKTNSLLLGYRIQIYNGGLIGVVGIPQQNSYAGNSLYTYIIYSTNQLGYSANYITR